VPRIFVLISLFISFSASVVAEVSVPPMRTRVISTRAELLKACGTTNRVFGCTSFAGQKLTCSCERVSDSWRIRGTAQFIPYVFIYAKQMDGIAHEKDHINDISRWLSDYVTDLEARLYGSSDECDRDAVTESASFTGRMDRWKVRSNEERHPELRAARR
jgi:hypothetical protein